MRIRARVPDSYTPPAEPQKSDDKRDDESSSSLVGPAPEKAKQAEEVATALAEKMGMRAKIEVADEEREIIVRFLEEEGSTEVADMLTSSRPPALPSLQFLLNKIVNRFPENRKHIVAEAPSVTERLAERRAKNAEEAARRSKTVQQEQPPPEDVDPELAALAKLLAERAAALGKVITIHPMAAADRRAIHLTIMGISGVETVSDGDGLYRQMHIIPEALAGRKSGGGGRRRRRRRGRRGGGRGEETDVHAPIE